MNWAAAQKRIEAESKRAERSALKRQREIRRMLKEQAKLSALEQARLELEAHENLLEVLLSVHKDASPNFDWFVPLSTLPPHSLGTSDLLAVEEQRRELEKMRSLAKRVLAEESGAYGEALTETSVFGELSTLGSSIGFTVHHPRLIECEVSVDGRGAIPAEMKSLTSAGKLSVKAMPKGRLHEIYQDYVCGCVLRVAREVLALLPIDSVIVTAKVPVVKASTGVHEEIPVLSVVVPRNTAESLNFTGLDPSDSMVNFLHRGDVTMSRKSGEFVPIIPLMPEDIVAPQTAKNSLADLVARVRQMRADIATKLKAQAESTEALIVPNLPA